MRLVLDTSVLVAALRSPAGASNELVAAVIQGVVRPIISVALVLEYEAVLTRPEHLEYGHYQQVEVEKIIRAFCRWGEPVYIARNLRPQLRDPNDEFVLEAAVYGKADSIVTFNRRDFEFAAMRFGIRVVTPSEALKILRNYEEK